MRISKDPVRDGVHACITYFAVCAIVPLPSLSSRPEPGVAEALQRRHDAGNVASTVGYDQPMLASATQQGSCSAAAAAAVQAPG